MNPWSISSITQKDGICFILFCTLLCSWKDVIFRGFQIMSKRTTLSRCILFNLLVFCGLFNKCPKMKNHYFYMLHISFHSSQSCPGPLSESYTPSWARKWAWKWDRCALRDGAVTVVFLRVACWVVSQCVEPHLCHYLGLMVGLVKDLRFMQCLFTVC